MTNEPDTCKIKTEISCFVVCAHNFFNGNLSGDRKSKLSVSISWMQVQMYHHRFNISPQILNGDPAKHLGKESIPVTFEIDNVTVMVSIKLMVIVPSGESVRLNV